MQLKLTEHEPSAPIRLEPAERDLISQILPRATVSAVPGTSDTYVINPRNYVGIINVGKMTIEISPKIGISRTLFMLSYSLDPAFWRNQEVSIADDISLNEAVAEIFVRRTRHALKKQPLRGYRQVDDSIHGVKGRIRFNDQLRKSQRLVVPLEVTFDDHTLDIVENQLILAAANKLRRLRHLGSDTASQLRSIERSLAEVELKQFHFASVPEPPITRLNKHYAPALRLARLILRNRTIELAGGSSPSDSLIFDMADVFETFVHTALSESLQVSATEFPRASRIPPLHLDNDQKIRLRPDLSWWNQGNCELVGDVKYKRDSKGDGREPDLYQMLAYAHSARLQNGTLIYARSEVEQQTSHTTVNGVALHVEALDLELQPTEILQQIDELATRLRSRRAQEADAAA